ncbi:MAG: hypothetical protein Q9181_005761 [Wetmoreana brouardii]
MPAGIPGPLLWEQFFRNAGLGVQVFIGIDFSSLIRSQTINLALLQTAAKLQELLIVASLATVTFQLLRHELIHGDGLPLGLLAAGFDFTKLSYFWSPEFAGTLRSIYSRPRKLRRSALVLFLVTVGALAALAGPSCAVLLIPQAQDWPAGGTTFYLNATRDQIWPAKLSAENVELEDTCPSEDAMGYGVCPSGGYHSIWAHYTRTTPQTYKNAVPTYARELSGNNYYWSSDSSPPVRVRTISLGIYDSYEITLIQPHLGVAIILDQLMRDWWQALRSKRGLTDKNVEDRAAVARVLSAMTSVKCSAAQNISGFDQAILFPGTHDFKMPRKQNLSRQHFNMNRLHMFNYLGTGAVFQSPWTADNKSRVVVGCTVQAQWVPAQIHTDAYSFWQGWYPKNITWAEAHPSAGRSLFNGSSTSSDLEAIAVDEGWLAMLTPPIGAGGPGYQEWRPTTIEGILGNSHLTDGLFNSDSHSPAEIWDDEAHSRTGLLMSIIGSVLNDGLARAGVENAFARDGDGPPSDWTLVAFEKADDFEDALLHGREAFRWPRTVADNESTEIGVEFSISELSYQLTLVQKLAMVVLFLHAFIALLQTMWMSWKRESSSCWDSIVEILVLAQNSRPTPALQNTAAGIKHSRTFAKQMAIRLTNMYGDRQDHLELIYEEDARQTKGTQGAIREVLIGQKVVRGPQLPNGSNLSAIALSLNVDPQAGHSRRVSHVHSWPACRLGSQSSPSESTEQILDLELEQMPDPESNPATPLIDSIESPESDAAPGS